MHKVILKEAAELMAPLYEGFHHGRLDQERTDTDNWTSSKMLVFRFDDDGEFTAYDILEPIDMALQRVSTERSAPRAKAIAKPKTLLWSRPGLYFDMMFELGDMQFVKNHLLMHSWIAYQHWPDLDNRRHLIRCWRQMIAWGSPPATQVFCTHVDRAGTGRGAHARSL